ncbi:MAG: septum formation initiator family protein [Acutalibacteraceae bacterium]|nr:septum formation initiator family protein [Acutalibacteraceae bacterium]
MALKEVETTKRNKRKTNKRKSNLFSINKFDFVLFGSLAVFVVYAVVVLISQHADINEKKAILDEKNNEIIIAEVKNEEISDILNSNKSDNAAYIEKTAREDLDYAYKDERIFINISGD